MNVDRTELDEPGGSDDALSLRWVVILAIAAATGITVGVKAGLAEGVTVGIAAAAFLHVIIP